MGVDIGAAITILLATFQLATTTQIKIPLNFRSSSNQARLPQHQIWSNDKGHNVDLKDWFNRTDNQWYSDISIGTPPQTLSVLWDTGSPFLLLPNNSCNNCGDHRLFSPGNSTTFTAIQPQTLDNISFVTGPDAIPLSAPQGATCTENVDKVSIGHLVVPDQAFLLCNSYAPMMNEQPMDGIIGLALPSATSVKSLFWSLWDSGQLESPVFSFYMPTGKIEGAELTLGGIDESRYTGNLSYTDLSPRPYALDLGWVLDQQAMYFEKPSWSHLSTQPFNSSGGGNAGQGLAILDTGTAFIQAPDDETAKAFYAEISPLIMPIDGSHGAWGAPCNQISDFEPKITFTLGTGSQAMNLSLPESSFNLGEYPGSPGICQTIINSPGIPSFDDNDTPVWIIGSPLLKAYYTVWDGINLKIGWGSMAFDSSVGR
ncbi:uncharacterized protein PG998_005260 [Apiospora kogelbergensis]|uniref:uncharacterized protein n=1 Tax=Apiospora kogelbergensis TaxID=1337665 RepID=UPI003131BA83